MNLIDTPGFNDTQRPDVEILNDIVDYIRSRNLKIVAVIYLHRITERKVTGSTRLNLRMLRAMCGEHYIQNIVFASTVWGTVSETSMAATELRETEINTSKSFWGDMLDRGAGYERWTGTAESARAIVQLCQRRKDVPPLNIQIELDKGKSMEETTAGIILTEQLRQRRERELAELAEEEEERKELEEKN